MKSFIINFGGVQLAALYMLYILLFMSSKRACRPPSLKRSLQPIQTHVQRQTGEPHNRCFKKVLLPKIFCVRILNTIIFNVHIGFAYRYLPRTVNDLTTNMTFRNHPMGIREVPHHVLVVYSNLYCSGSLITSRIVLTAATCLLKYRGGAVVKLGADSITGYGEIIAVQEIKIHEYFGRLSSFDNDIAMLLLMHDVSFGGIVSKAAFMEPNTALYEGSSLLVSGYGGNNVSSNNRNNRNSLLVSEMILLNSKACQDTLGPVVTASIFCAKYNLEQELNDNGGGALYHNLLVGILSYKFTEEEPTIAIFTNVSYFHRWLELNTMKLIAQCCTKIVNKDDPQQSDVYVH